MGDQKMKPFIPALIGLLSILGIAVISDHILWQLQRQAMQSPEFTPLVIWANAIIFLLLGITYALVAWYLFAKLIGSYPLAWLYIAVGLLLLIYPAFYYSQIVWINTLFGWLLGYLGQYHGYKSFLYASGGIIAGIGMVWLAAGRQSSISRHTS